MTAHTQTLKFTRCPSHNFCPISLTNRIVLKLLYKSYTPINHRRALRIWSIIYLEHVIENIPLSWYHTCKNLKFTECSYHNFRPTYIPKKRRLKLLYKRYIPTTNRISFKIWSIIYLGHTSDKISSHQLNMRKTFKFTICKSHNFRPTSLHQNKCFKLLYIVSML